MVLLLFLLLLFFLIILFFSYSKEELVRHRKGHYPGYEEVPMKTSLALENRGFWKEKIL